MEQEQEQRRLAGVGESRDVVETEPDKMHEFFSVEMCEWSFPGRGNRARKQENMGLFIATSHFVFRGTEEEKKLETNDNLMHCLKDQAEKSTEYARWWKTKGGFVCLLV